LKVTPFWVIDSSKVEFSTAGTLDGLPDQPWAPSTGRCEVMAYEGAGVRAFEPSGGDSFNSGD